MYIYKKNPFKYNIINKYNENNKNNCNFKKMISILTISYTYSRR